MNRQEYLDKLNSLVSLGDTLKAIVYFAIKSEDGSINVKRANIKTDVLDTLATQYKESLSNEILRLNSDGELDVLDLSTRDERSNVIYRYDLPNDEPSFFSSMREVMDSHPAGYFSGDRMFDFNNDCLSDINYYIISVGTENNKIVIYRNNYNINLLKQGRGRLYFTKSGTQFDIVSEDILRIDTQMDAIMLDNDANDVLILNLSYLDKNKEFASIIIKRAEASVAVIRGLEIVDTVDGINDRLSELSFARRLMGAVDSSPVTEMPKNAVFEFIRQHDKLKNILKIEDDKIKLSSKKSQDWFVRLLNDDFLYSKLTKKDYETKAKGPVK